MYVGIAACRNAALMSDDMKKFYLKQPQDMCCSHLVYAQLKANIVWVLLCISEHEIVLTVLSDVCLNPV